MKLRALIPGLFFFFFAAATFAAATVQNVSGDVRIFIAGSESALKNSQAIDSGATITTGGTGHAVLRFDDGQVTALSPNSSFKIDNYRFEAAKPEQGNVALSLLKGTLRMITGLIGQRNRGNFALRTPNATIGIRGTDFMVAIANAEYTSVIEGGITVSNAAGSVGFAAGEIGAISSASTLAVAIPVTALPAAVSATFLELGAMPLAGAAGAAGASGATAASAGAISAGSVAAVAVGVAAVAAGASSDNGSATSTATATAP